LDVGKERIFGKIGIASYCLGNLFSFGGCAGLTHTEQRILSGGQSVLV